MSGNHLSIQYILIITDHLVGWPLGAVVAQACHAVSACMARFRDLPEYREYIADENIDGMRKAVLACTFRKWTEIKENLVNGEVKFVEWHEQPENVLTAVALVPGLKGSLKPFVSELKLLY